MHIIITMLLDWYSGDINKWYVNIVVNQMVHEIMALNGAYNNGHEGTKHN